MPDLVKVNYARTGASTKTNCYGMREMQERAYASRDAQYLLLKAPPASGKSRALMFIALDKLVNQGLKKVIVAVPERSIGSSFKETRLSQFGFFADWIPEEHFNLCTPGADNSKSKVEAFKAFLADSKAKILICTHATLRFAYNELDDSAFDDCLLAIDEFHHVSADTNNSRLGDLLHGILNHSTAHIIAMTGSYFRGDTIAILLPEDEAKFVKVTYNYYEQLNGYTYLKSLGIGYHFYQGKYTTAIGEVLDTDKKTILHIPNVNSGESTKDKFNEVDFIIDSIGTVESQDKKTGVIHVKRHSDGKILKVADLVNDNPAERDKIVKYLREIKSADDMDLIIALNMAKEGFDWPYCEHALTVAYRGSLTEIIQIIGRCTRDSENKTHAQFTNLVAQPDATDEQVKVSVNNMLKAITASLLMEQVLAPSFKFKTKLPESEPPVPGTIYIRGLKEPSSQRVKDILESDLDDLKATILQDDNMQKAMPGQIEPEVINKVLIPKIISTRYPELSDAEIEEVRQHVVVDSVIKNSTIQEVGNKKFITMGNRFVDIQELNIDLIDQINPFQKAFEILSKNVTAPVLKLVQEAIDALKINISVEDAVKLYPKIKEFRISHGRAPSVRATDPQEMLLAQALIKLREEKRKRMANNGH